MKIYDENGLIDSDVQEVLYELGNVGLGMASVAIGKLMGLRLNIGVQPNSFWRMTVTLKSGSDFCLILNVIWEVL